MTPRPSPVPPRRAVSPRVTFAARKGGAFYPGELERARSAPALPHLVKTGHDALNRFAEHLPAVVFDECGLHVDEHGAPNVEALRQAVVTLR